MENDYQDEKCYEKEARPATGNAPSTVNFIQLDQDRAQLNAQTKQVHQGSVSFTSFYLFLSGTFLFTMACALLVIGAWCLLVRLPMIHLVRGPTEIIVALSGYMVAAGALTFPASCILYGQHNVTLLRRRRSLLPVVVLLSICTVFLIFCASHAIGYRKSAYSNLEDSVSSSARLRCCGVNETIQQAINSTPSAMPPYCFKSSHDEEDNSETKKKKTSTPRPGCLDAITLDLMWITAYIVGLCFIAIFADVLVILSIGILLQKADSRNE